MLVLQTWHHLSEHNCMFSALISVLVFHRESPQWFTRQLYLTWDSAFIIQAGKILGPYAVLAVDKMSLPLRIESFQVLNSLRDDLKMIRNKAFIKDYADTMTWLNIQNMAVMFWTWLSWFKCDISCSIHDSGVQNMKCYVLCMTFMLHTWLSCSKHDMYVRNMTSHVWNIIVMFWTWLSCS